MSNKVTLPIYMDYASTTPVDPVGDGLITHSDQLYVADPVKPKEYRLDPSTIESTEEYKIDTSKESHREKIGGGETELFVHLVPFQLNHSQDEHILPWGGLAHILC